PALELLVDRLRPVEEGLMRRDVVEQLPIGSVAGAYADPGESGQDVELGQEELREAVQAARVPNDHSVEPAATPLAAGRRTELPTALTHAVAVRPHVLGREGTGAHAGHVGLGDADDTLDLARADPGGRERIPRDGIRRGHERVGAVIEVEQG